MNHFQLTTRGIAKRKVKPFGFMMTMRLKKCNYLGNAVFFIYLVSPGYLYITFHKQPRAYCIWFRTCQVSEIPTSWIPYKLFFLYYGKVLWFYIFVYLSVCIMYVCLHGHLASNLYLLKNGRCHESDLSITSLFFNLSRHTCTYFVSHT